MDNNNVDSNVIEMPGGQLASRPLHFFWIVDVSGSMFGDKIGAVNHAISSCIPDMLGAAKENPNAQLYVRTLKFSTGASWVNSEPQRIEDYSWNELEAGGITDLGAALTKIAEQLNNEMPKRALPPVLVLLSDGQPTDNYKKGLEALYSSPWGKKAVKIAIAIGADADEKVLQEYTRNVEMVLKAKDATTLVKLIKWASTVASLVSQSKITEQNASFLTEKDESGEVKPVDSSLPVVPPVTDDLPEIDSTEAWSDVF